MGTLPITIKADFDAIEPEPEPKSRWEVLGTIELADTPMMTVTRST